MNDVTLMVKIPEELYSKFRKAATNKKGKWRGVNQTADKAFQTAIQAALLHFMSSLEDPTLADRMMKALIE
jgi:hypothetical protein